MLQPPMKRLIEMAISAFTKAEYEKLEFEYIFSNETAGGFGGKFSRADSSDGGKEVK